MLFRSVKCGVGKVNAAMCTQSMIDLFSVDAIINTGIAGSLDADIDIGDIVIATDTVEHDMDVAALGYAPGIIPDTETSVFKTDTELLETAQASVEAAKLDVKVFTGRVVSGDQFISSREKKKWLVSEFGGDEGAAASLQHSSDHLIHSGIHSLNGLDRDRKSTRLNSSHAR